MLAILRICLSLPSVFFFCATLLIAGAFSPRQAWAAPGKAGMVISVSQGALAISGKEKRILELRSPIFVGDVIKTDATGSAQILFDDDSILAIAEDGEVTVNRFVYSGKGGAASGSYAVAGEPGAEAKDPAFGASGGSSSRN